MFIQKFFGGARESHKIRDVTTQTPFKHQHSVGNDFIYCKRFEPPCTNNHEGLKQLRA